MLFSLLDPKQNICLLHIINTNFEFLHTRHSLNSHTTVSLANTYNWYWLMQKYQNRTRCDTHVLPTSHQRFTHFKMLSFWFLLLVATHTYSYSIELMLSSNFILVNFATHHRLILYEYNISYHIMRFGF